MTGDQQLYHDRNLCRRKETRDGCGFVMGRWRLISTLNGHAISKTRAIQNETRYCAR